MPRGTPVSKRRLAHLQALCLAGLTPGDFVTAWLEALHGVIPSVRNLFDHTDAQGRLLHYYVEGPVDADIARHYFDQFHNLRETECMPAFASLAEAPIGVRSAQPLMTRAFFGSALYQEVWKPQGLHMRLEGIVRDETGRLLGSLVLYRGATDPVFTTDEEQALAAVLPWMARGLRAAGDAVPDDPRFVPSPESAETVLLDDAGQLLGASAGASRLLLLADEGLTVTALTDGSRGIKTALQRILGRLLRAEACRRPPDTPAALWDDSRSLTLINAHGRFSAVARRVHPLAPGAASPLTQITLQRLEPHAVALYRTLRRLPLTAGQIDVCASLYHRHSTAEVARAQGVAYSTVVDHTRKIYRALEVRNLLELRQYVDQAMAP